MLLVSRCCRGVTRDSCRRMVHEMGESHRKHPNWGCHSSAGGQKCEYCHRHGASLMLPITILALLITGGAMENPGSR
ncbi:hypothetical protein N7524_011235 [Penicillium chrysogenum]|nr:hypothetical protein N7524_011235 [Penicillium chrysogenum]